MLPFCHRFAYIAVVLPSYIQNGQWIFFPHWAACKYSLNNTHEHALLVGPTWRVMPAVRNTFISWEPCWHIEPYIMYRCTYCLGNGFQMSPPFHTLRKVGLHESINHYIMLPYKVICRPYTTHVQIEVNLNNSNLTKLGNGCNPFTLSFTSFLYPCSFCWILTIYCVSCGWEVLIVQPSIPTVWTQDFTGLRRVAG